MSCEEESKIPQIYDKLLELIAAALPCSFELDDPENLELNTPGQLDAGFGLSFAEGENTDRCIDACGYYQERTFDLIVTRKHEYVAGDKKTKTDNLKALMGDLHKVIKALAGTHTIIGDVDQMGRTEVLSFKVKYESDGGPVGTQIEGANYLFAELSVTAEYREPLTGGN